MIMSRLTDKRSLAAAPAPTIREDLQRDAAYNQLRRHLILQQIQPGSRLAEVEWANRLSVNRTALREAFARLESEGLIRRGEKTGYVVPVLTEEDEFNTLLVRLALEGCAIDVICTKGLNTPEGLERLTNACNLLEQLVGEEYHLSTVEADWRFHESLIEAAHNHVLTIAYRHAPVPILHAAIKQGPDWVRREERSIREHRDVLAAILRGDADEAKRILRQHLIGAWEVEHKKAASA
ncbi:MAG: GntR family transcriptional regulator [Phycisphaerae bacterium]